MVDRITPRTTDDDVRAVAEQTGWADAVPVVTEPFSEWVLSGAVPGRPPGVGRRRRPVRRRRPSARDAQAAPAQRRTQPAGVRRQRARPRHDRGGRRRTRSAAAGWTGGGTRPPGMCHCPPRIWPPTGRRCWSGSRTRASGTRSRRSRRTVRRRCRSACCRWCAASGPPAGCPPAPCGSWPPGSTTCAESARRSTTPRAGPYRERAASPRDVLSLLAPDLAGDTDLVDAIDEAVYSADRP